MTYAIYIKVIQKNANKFVAVEKTCWYYANGGTWTENEGRYVLTMGGSGTSGTLRFSNQDGDTFIVATGIHNYKRWCDIVPNLASSNTGMEVHPTYYSGSRGEMLWKQLESIEKYDAKGRKLALAFTAFDGNELFATLTIE
ncbi:lectin 3a [Crucibulum laeve]|uniref:Lectin 3a n=1 Tax=Crucibulum laeve TaxID=68775 RepID=A0A5C3M284_9AGAR|nr:lectin 3a [Crucibulum laeve]